MSVYLFDTDMLTLYFNQQPKVVQTIVAHLADQLATTVITVEEVVHGWSAAVRSSRTQAQVALGYERLALSLTLLQSWTIYPYPVPAIARYEHLKQLKLNVGKNDLRIAAIALELGAVVVTRNVRDFARVPGCTWQDWS